MEIQQGMWSVPGRLGHQLSIHHLLNMVAVEKGVRDLLVDHVREKCFRRLYVAILEENVRGSLKEMRQMSG